MLAWSTPNYNRPMFVRDLGEFDLIDRLESSIRFRNDAQVDLLRNLGIRVEVGIGDDAAAWSYPESKVVGTTDAMVEDIHFIVGKMPWRDLGWKALASNLSDVGAMGCSPAFALVTLGLRGDLPVDGLIEMYGGMMDVLELTGGALIGGDVVRSDTFFVSVSLEGFAEAGANVLRRNCARAGDDIAVTGHLGSSAGGLRLILEDGLEDRIDPATSRHLATAHNRPTPRVAEGLALRKLGVRCAMDISDGLTADLTKVCVASGLGARIEAGRIPADSHLKSAFPSDWLHLALGGGEDYELVFCAPSATMDRVTDELGSTVSVIGKMVGDNPKVTVVSDDGTEVIVGSAGWDHFSSQNG